MKNNIIVLYPSGLKPMHGGHLDLLSRYSELPEVSEIRILIGPGVRNGIDQKKSLEIVNRLIKDLPKVSAEAVTWPSPVLTAYKILEKAEPGYYALASSSKGDDYKRVEDFVAKHSIGGKYSRENEGVYVIELPVDSDPLLFIGRDDEYEGTPISSSILRKDIMNDDLENFATGYPDSSPADIEWIWIKLANVVMNESFNNSRISDGPNIDSTGSNYDRSQPGYFYKSMFPILEEDDDPEDISEGGGAGHLSSPWENIEITFGEIKDIISKTLDGKLENVSEKLDGVNLMITVKNGEVYLGRSKKEMAERGKLSKRWDIAYEDIREDTPEKIKRMLQSFRNALEDLQKAIEAFSFNPNIVFEDGKRWLNIELLNPDAENIIPYMESQMRIHNIREVDEKGEEIDTIFDGPEMQRVLDEFDKIQESGELKVLHQIKQTNKPVVDPSKKLEKIKRDLHSKVDELMSKYKLDDKNTIGDFLAEEFRLLAEEIIEDKEIQDKLVNRWAYGIKTPNINQITKGLSPEIIKTIKATDDFSNDVSGKFLDPIIEIFSKLGIEILKNIKGLAATNPEAVTDKMKEKVSDAINKIESYIERGQGQDFDKKLKYLETQLRRFHQGGGYEGITPSEGIVFDYNGKLLKLTGIYLPILKMINFFQFGKDK